MDGEDEEEEDDETPPLQGRIGGRSHVKNFVSQPNLSNMNDHYSLTLQLPFRLVVARKSMNKVRTPVAPLSPSNPFSTGKVRSMCGSVGLVRSYVI